MQASAAGATRSGCGIAQMQGHLRANNVDVVDGEPSASDQSEYDLVFFEHAPVQEVALSVQFAPETFDIEAIGRFAHDTRDELPGRQRQPALPPMVESFEKVTAPPSMEIRLEPLTVLPRMWFPSADDTQLVQLQHDRLTLNWRELDRGAGYPRYSQLRERFARMLSMLVAGSEDGGKTVVANLCEVTYVNTIDPREDAEEGPTGHPQLADVINHIRPRPEDAFLPAAEDAQLTVRWRIPGSEIGKDENEPAGRLYLHAAPGVKPTSFAPIYLVNLTAHVIPPVGTVDGALRALDVAHRWAALGFKDLTTPEMHRLWGLKEQSR